MIDSNTPIEYQYCENWPKNDISLGEMNLKQAIEYLDKQYFNSNSPLFNFNREVEVLELYITKSFLIKPIALRINNPAYTYSWMFWNEEADRWESNDNPDDEFMNHIEEMILGAFEKMIAKVEALG